MAGECVLALLCKCIQSNKNGYHRASHGWKRQVGKNRLEDLFVKIKSHGWKRQDGKNRLEDLFVKIKSF